MSRDDFVYCPLRSLRDTVGLQCCSEVGGANRAHYDCENR